MKSANLAKFFAVSLILAVTAVGCKKTPKGVTAIPQNQRPFNSTATPNPPLNSASTLPEDQNPSRITRNQDGTVPFADQRQDEGNFFADRETFKQQTIYFDLDSSSVKPGEKFKVEAVATFLKSNPKAQVRVEGNCDERGTDEYNRALGERRALAARESLVGLGIAAERVATVSYGKDRPAVQGTGEDAWAKNRRDEFVLLTPKQ